MARDDAEWQVKEKQFEQTLFYVAVPWGLTAIVIGALLSKQAAGAGLMFGGLFARAMAITIIGMVCPTPRSLSPY